MESDVCFALDQIEKPFLVSIEESAFGDRIDLRQLSTQVANRLGHLTDEPRVFEDRHDNRIVLRVEANPNLTKVVTAGVSAVEWVNAAAHRGILSNKAKQHQGIREAGYPYGQAGNGESTLNDALSSRDSNDEPAEKLLERIRAARDNGPFQPQAKRQPRRNRKRGS